MRKMTKRQKRAKEKRYLERQQKKMTLDGAQIAVDVLGVIPAYVLHEAFGFGYARMTRYILEYQRILSTVTKGGVKLETLAAVIEADTGLLYSDGGWEDKGKRRRMSVKE